MPDGDHARRRTASASAAAPAQSLPVDRVRSTSRYRASRTETTRTGQVAAGDRPDMLPARQTRESSAPPSGARVGTEPPRSVGRRGDRHRCCSHRQTDRPTTIASTGVPPWSSEADIGVRKTASEHLPPADRAASVLARALVEVLSGQRPLAQLRVHCAPEIYAGLGERPSRDRMALPHLLTVRVCEPADGVAEVERRLPSGRPGAGAGLSHRGCRRSVADHRAAAGLIADSLAEIAARETTAASPQRGPATSRRPGALSPQPSAQPGNRGLRSRAACPWPPRTRPRTAHRRPAGRRAAGSCRPGRRRARRRRPGRRRRRW